MDNFHPADRGGRMARRSHAGCPLCDSCRNVLLLFNACRPDRLSAAPAAPVAARAEVRL